MRSEKGTLNRCFIIAEAGVNHNGDINLAKQLIVAAKQAGADAVKFQTWITELIVTEHSSSAGYQEANTGVKSQFELLKELELSHEQFTDLKRYAESIDILFLSTPDEETSARFLIDDGLKLIKVGSGELTNLPFLDFLAREGLPMIISTGMSTLDEVQIAVETIKSAGNSDLSLLHCVSNYPADPSECNLRAMQTMREEFDLPVGYSDHTMGNEMCLAAVALGAGIIEKHLTLDQGMEGPDHSCSSEPKAFAEMVQSIRNIESGMGDGVKRPTLSEMETRKVVRKEIVAASDLPAGHCLRLQDIALKRGNGEGMDSNKIEDVIGQVINLETPKNGTILWSNLDTYNNG